MRSSIHSLIPLRDALLSFAPLELRQKIRPYSPATTLKSATWLGLAQFVTAAFMLLARYRSFFMARAQQWASPLRGTAEWVQSGTAVIITVEFFLYPLSLLLVYLAIEGFARFAAGIVTSEVVPSLPIVLGWKIIAGLQTRREMARLRSLPPDQLQVLPAEKLEIASAQPKPGWTASATIAIGEHWYEVESERSGPAPLSWIYVLRPAPAGKILRRLERYDPPSTARLH
jgi:hypothetical protein